MGHILTSAPALSGLRGWKCLWIEIENHRCSYCIERDIAYCKQNGYNRIIGYIPMSRAQYRARLVIITWVIIKQKYIPMRNVSEYTCSGEAGHGNWSCHANKPTSTYRLKTIHF